MPPHDIITHTDMPNPYSPPSYTDAITTPVKSTRYYDGQDIDFYRDPSLQEHVSRWSRFKTTVRTVIDRWESPPPTYEPSKTLRSFRRAQRRLDRFATRLKELVTRRPPRTIPINSYQRQTGPNDTRADVFSSQLNTPPSSTLLPATIHPITSPHSCTVSHSLIQPSLSGTIPKSCVPPLLPLSYPPFSSKALTRKPVASHAPLPSASPSVSSNEAVLTALAKSEFQQKVPAASDCSTAQTTPRHPRVENRLRYETEKSVEVPASLHRPLSFVKTYQQGTECRIITAKGERTADLTRRESISRRSRQGAKKQRDDPSRAETVTTILTGTTLNEPPDASPTLVDSIKRRLWLTTHALDNARLYSDRASINSTPVEFHHHLFTDDKRQSSIGSGGSSPTSPILPQFDWEKAGDPWFRLPDTVEI